jgi:hypothetical protein
MDEINVFVKMPCYSAYPGSLAMVTNYPICCHDIQAASSVLHAFQRIKRR